MDSEDYNKVQDLIRDGRHPGDEGPFYHHTFWESYKSSIAGKVGGFIIGAAIGAGAGVVAAMAIAALAASGLITLAITTPLIAGIIGGFAAAGMLYGSHEFSETGRVSGAVAAAQKDAETRMQAFEKSKFAELKSEIDELKQLAKGQTPDGAAARAAAAKAIAIEKDLNDYRTTHLRRDIPVPKGNSLVFWKVALAGLVLGSAIGALLPLTGIGASILAPLGLGAVSQYVASTIAFGAIGASFGVNRDLFRATFDKTDVWFKGVFNLGNNKTGGKNAQPRIDSEDFATPVKTTPVNTLIYPETNVEDAIQSDTFHRDRVLASAQKALQDLDHTNARAH